MDKRETTSETERSTEHHTTNATSGINRKRRRVLQGVGALGALSASGVVGSVSAHNGNDHNNGKAKGKDKGPATGEERPIGIQFWSLRNLEEPVSETIHRVAEAGYDGAEPFTLGEEDPSDIAAAFEEADIEPAGIHVGLEELEENFEETVDSITEAGIETFVVPSSPEELWQTVEGVSELAERMNTLADKLEERGLKFAYHNHDQEFVDLGNRTAYECWVDQTNDNVLLQLDAGWVDAAGYNPTALAVRYADRVDSYHVKDMHVDEEDGEHEFASLGEGDLNVESLITAGVHVDGDVYLIFEHDDPGESEEEIIEEMNNGLEVISEVQDQVLGRSI